MVSNGNGRPSEEIRLRLKVSGPGLDRDEMTVGRNGLRAGRSDENSLVLSHREISRQHMRIVWDSDEDKYLVEDLNSSNGVWLNEIRLTPRVPVEIDIGNTIRVGPYLLTVEEFVFTQVAPPIRPPVPSDASLETPLVPARALEYMPGIPHDASTWMTYLPEIYQQDEFIGRFLLIFESMFAPIVWTVDNFDLYLTPDIAPYEWLSWMAGWFDLLLLEELPIERQRQLMEQIGWLFLRRGTRAGLERLLEIYFGISPEIIETDPCHFVVVLPLSESETGMSREVALRLIESQRPAFASFDLQTT